MPIFLCPDILEVLSNAWPAGDALLDVRPMDENAAIAGQMHLQPKLWSLPLIQ